MNYKKIGRIIVLCAFLNGTSATSTICFRFNLDSSEPYSKPIIPVALIPFPVYNLTDSKYIVSGIYCQNSSNYYMQLDTGKIYYIQAAYITYD